MLSVKTSFAALLPRLQRKIARYAAVDLLRSNGRTAGTLPTHNDVYFKTFCQEWTEVLFIITIYAVALAAAFLFRMARIHKSPSNKFASAQNRAQSDGALGKIILLAVVFVILCAVLIAAVAVINLQDAGGTAGFKESAEDSFVIEENAANMHTALQNADEKVKSAASCSPFLNTRGAAEPFPAAIKPPCAAAPLLLAPHNASASGKSADEKTERNARPADAFAIPLAQNNAALVFVFDDAGLSVDNVRRYTELPFPVTIAVLPRLRQSKACAAAVRNSGNEVILHQPMQALNRKLDPGPGAILPDMPPEKIISVLKTNAADIAPIQGLNNHEGSLITQDLSAMKTVLAVADELGLFFLDSKTTSMSKGRQAAALRGMEIYERDVFIDDVVTRCAMLSEIYRGIDIANRSGSAILIGHIDKSVGILPQLLCDLYPHLIKLGYRFSTVSNSPIKRGEPS